MKGKKSSGKKTDEVMILDSDSETRVGSFSLESIMEVEELLGYKFENKMLLVEALTHSSHPDAESYQRLEFVGDAALTMVITNHIYLCYPNLDPGDLSVLRAANISTEKLARVAVRYGFYQYLRRNTPSLDEKVGDFTLYIKGEIEEAPYGGDVKAPKVLADIVESIAAAIYVDSNFNLEVLWMVFRVLLEPIVTKETLQPQPVTALYEFCQKHGNHLDFQEWKKGAKTIVSVYVNRKLITSCSSEQKDTAKLNAAKDAMQQLMSSQSSDMEMDAGMEEKEGAKQRLNELCRKNRWSKPLYRLEKELGPAHGKRFIYSVQVKTPDGLYESKSDEEPRVKDAENSAAAVLLTGLQGIKNSYAKH
ncbi:RNAse THREE-like protein 2 [Tasmannia lanceolata]|uniref:RNAse THREE-like protein 2 n=1 Tax=Tasmannia lanceolata TaxID=3420 RepID=UPI0040646072